MYKINSDDRQGKYILKTRDVVFIHNVYFLTIIKVRSHWGAATEKLFSVVSVHIGGVSAAMAKCNVIK